MVIEGRKNHAGLKSWCAARSLAFVRFAGNCLLPIAIHDELALNRILRNSMPRKRH